MTSYPGGRFTPAPETYGMSIEAAVPVEVDDGTVLRADIVYPTDLRTGERAAGPFPVILSQDIYSIGPDRELPAQFPPEMAALMLPWRYFVPRGYIFVHLNCRGTGGSDGVMDLHGKRTGLDGVFMASWVANPDNVPGSNGVVGLEGCSALGVVQLNTLAQMGGLQRLGQLDPAANPIKASIAKCISGDGYRDLLFDNGIPTSVWFGIPPGPTPAGFDTPQLMAGGEPGFHKAAFWTERDRVSLADDIARTGVPILLDVGWEEGAFIGGFEMYAALQNAAAGRPYLGPMTAGQPLTSRYQLVIGAWGHGGGLDRGAEEAWFATWLNGVKTGVETSKTPLHVQERPSGKTARWLNLQTYPVAPTATRYFLDGPELSPEAPRQPGSEKLVWAQGQSATYTLADAFDRDMTLAGPSAVTVWATSSNSNMQLFAQVNDVAPDGSTSEITHASTLASRLRLDADRSWVASDGAMVRPYPTHETDTPIAPGEPIRIDIPLQPSMWRLQAGHRLQLVLYSQAPQALCDIAARSIAPAPLGTWWTMPMARSLAGGQYEILRGADHPSSLNVTLLPSDSIPLAASGVTPTSMDVPRPHDWG